MGSSLFSSLAPLFSSFLFLIFWTLTLSMSSSFLTSYPCHLFFWPCHHWAMNIVEVAYSSFTMSQTPLSHDGWSSFIWMFIYSS
jgi:hypothetical protein